MSADQLAASSFGHARLDSQRRGVRSLAWTVEDIARHGVSRSLHGAATKVVQFPKEAWATLWTRRRLDSVRHRMYTNMFESETLRSRLVGPREWGENHGGK
jgi:hypothetical protein